MVVGRPSLAGCVGAVVPKAPVRMPTVSWDGSALPIGKPGREAGTLPKAGAGGTASVSPSFPSRCSSYWSCAAVAVNGVRPRVQPGELPAQAAELTPGGAGLVSSSPEAARGTAALDSAMTRIRSNRGSPSHRSVLAAAR